jgi:hypothetical protein
MACPGEVRVPFGIPLPPKALGLGFSATWSTNGLASRLWREPNGRAYDLGQPSDGQRQTPSPVPITPLVLF